MLYQFQYRWELWRSGATGYDVAVNSEKLHLKTKCLSIYVELTKLQWLMEAVLMEAVPARCVSEVTSSFVLVFGWITVYL